MNRQRIYFLYDERVRTKPDNVFAFESNAIVLTTESTLEEARSAVANYFPSAVIYGYVLSEAGFLQEETLISE